MVFYGLKNVASNKNYSKLALELRTIHNGET